MRQTLQTHPTKELFVIVRAREVADIAAADTFGTAGASSLDAADASSMGSASWRAGDTLATTGALSLAPSAAPSMAPSVAPTSHEDLGHQVWRRSSVCCSESGQALVRARQREAACSMLLHSSVSQSMHWSAAGPHAQVLQAIPYVVTIGRLIST